MGKEEEGEEEEEEEGKEEVGGQRWPTMMHAAGLRWLK